MGMQTRAFRPLAVSQQLAVTAGAASITLNNINGTRAVRIVNNGSTAVWVSSVTVATTTTAMVILGNTTEIITVGPEVSILSFISTGAAGTVNTTVGEGR